MKVNFGKRQWTTPKVESLPIARTATKDFFTTEFNGVGDPPSDVGPS